MPREPNRLSVRPLGEREAEALRLIEAHPGVTARAELDEFLRGREEWPRRPEFVAAGLGGLRQVMYRDGTTDYWMAQYGMTVRHVNQNV